MRPPITIDWAGDVKVFETIAEAERSLEPADLESADVIIYDADGEVLGAERAGRHFLRADAIAIRPLSGRPGNVPSLDVRLRRFLRALKQPEAFVESATVATMLTELLELQRGNRRR